MQRLALIALILALPTGIVQSPAVATDVTKADIDATLKRAPADGVMDQQMRVIDIGKYNVAVGVLHRAAKAKQTAIAHAQVTEVYHIIAGSGAFVTGGTIVDATPVSSDSETHKVLTGRSTTGSSVRGGQTRQIGPGDGSSSRRACRTGSAPSTPT